MNRQTSSGNCIAKRPASSRLPNELQRVTHELESVTRENSRQADPIVEQLKQCPEAFKVGEILGKAFDSLKCAQDGGELGDRYLPPAGVIIPPLV